LKNTILFLDLDNTLFQTKRRNENGITNATKAINPENISYMTKAQESFLNLFLESKNAIVIPTTARDLRQYRNTLISQNEKINTAILYFSAVILENNEIDKIWQEKIQEQYSNLKISVEKVFEYVESIADKEIFKLYNVDSYYVALKNRNKNNPKCKEQNENLLKKLEKFINEQYYIAYEDNNISIVPTFLDKKFAVEYLIEKYKPALTIGAGDSISDISFLQSCNFMLIPQKSQINNKLIS